MAEVYEYGEGLVVKLDRPEWSGVSAFESEVITKVEASGDGVVELVERLGQLEDDAAWLRGVAAGGIRLFA